MEYITHEDLEQFSAYLTDLVVGSSRLNAKIEAFTSRYRKPTRIGRSRSSATTALPKKVEALQCADDAMKESTSRVPSYLATGIILDGESASPRLEQQQQSTILGSFSNNHSHDASMSSASLFAQSLSTANHQELMEPTVSMSTIHLPMPRRQRSFSLSSCYTMRKPARRRTSSLGDLNEPSSRVLLMDMIAALNEAFPDYDFGDSKKEQFKEQDLPVTMRLINGYFTELSLREPDLLEKLWSAVDEIVNLKHCEIFQYIPNDDDDDADTYLWCFHYFFFNKELHTLCYFNCSADR